MLDKFPFLTSTRFWAVVLIAIAGYLQSAGFTWDPNALGTALKIVAGGHIGIRTLDRASEKAGGKDTA